MVRMQKEYSEGELVPTPDLGDEALLDETGIEIGAVVPLD